MLTTDVSPDYQMRTSQVPHCSVAAKLLEMYDLSKGSSDVPGGPDRIIEINSPHPEHAHLPRAHGVPGNDIHTVVQPLEQSVDCRQIHWTCGMRSVILITSDRSRSLSIARAGACPFEGGIAIYAELA